MRIAVKIVIFIIPFFELSAQQLPLYSLYHLNGFFFNPAIAGASGGGNVNLSARNMWVGYKEAPSTYVLSAEYRLLKRPLELSNLFGIKKMSKRTKGNFGTGGYIYQDNNANLQQTGISGALSYNIKLRYSQLSFGLSSQLFQYKLNKGAFNPVEDEPLLYSSHYSSLCLDATVGVYFLAKNDAYIGLSGNELLQTIDFRPTVSEYSIFRHYYLVFGYPFALAKGVIFEPSTLVKFNEDFHFQSDITCKMKFFNKYWGGLSYRSNNDLVVLFGFSFNRMYLAYGFDYGMGSNFKHTAGSHEINIGALWGTSKRRERWMDRY